MSETSHQSRNRNSFWDKHFNLGFIHGVTAGNVRPQVRKRTLRHQVFWLGLCEHGDYAKLRMTSSDSLRVIEICPSSLVEQLVCPLAQVPQLRAKQPFFGLGDLPLQTSPSPKRSCWR